MTARLQSGNALNGSPLVRATTASRAYGLSVRNFHKARRILRSPDTVLRSGAKGDVR